MTATTSTAKSFFKNRFLSDIAQNKKILIINFVLELLGLPVATTILLIIAHLENLKTNQSFEHIYLMLIPFLVLAAFTTAVSIFLGCVIALFHFDYLYRKPIVDMNYSLPLSTNQRFFADYISGLLIYLVPVFVSVILSFMILGVGCTIVDLSDVSQFIPYIIKAGFIVIAGMFMLYTVSVFSISFCGSTFEAIFSIIAVIITVPAAICCVWLLIISSSSYGMTIENIINSPVLTASSPIGAVIFFCVYFFGAMDEVDYEGHTQFYDSMYIRWMAVALIVTLIYLAASFFLYKFRKAEDVSKPYVYKMFFYVNSGLSVFCIMSLFIGGNINVIPAIVMCAVGWFIMEVINRRGFKRFWTAPIGFAAAVLSVFAVSTVCKVTDGFGAAKHVPAAISVESVNLHFSDGNIFDYDLDNVQFHDRDVIKATTEFNKEIADRHFNFDKYSYNYLNQKEADGKYGYPNNCYHDDCFITISYQTIYGSTVMREYNVPSYMLSDLTKAILLSDEYAEYAANELCLNIANNNSEDRYYRKYNETLKGTLKTRLVVSNKFMTNSNNAVITRDTISKIHDAYETDLKNMTEEDLDNMKVYGYIQDMWILDSFENTKSVLSDIDLAVKELDIYDSIDEVNQNTNINYEPHWCFDIKSNIKSIESERFSLFGYYDDDYDEDDYYKDRFEDLETITVLNDNNRYYDSYDSYGNDNSHIRINKDLQKVFDSCTPIVIGKKPLAVLQFRNQNYYLVDTPENQKILEDFLSNRNNEFYEYKKNYDYDDYDEYGNNIYY